jgi:flagellar hook-length control protein FliK
LPTAGIQPQVNPAKAANDAPKAGTGGFAEALDSLSQAGDTDAAPAPAGSVVPADATITLEGSKDAVGQNLPQDGKELPLSTPQLAPQEHAIELVEAAVGKIPDGTATADAELLNAVADPGELVDLEPVVEQPDLLATPNQVPASVTPVNPLLAEALTARQLSPGGPAAKQVADELVEVTAPGELLADPAEDVTGGIEKQLAMPAQNHISESLSSVPARPGAEVPVPQGLPIVREATVLAEKADFAVDMEAVLQAAGADGDSPLQSQSTLQASPRLGVAELPQELKATMPLPMHATVGTENFDQELAARMRWMLSGNTQQANLQLNPAELGQLDIQISTEGDETRLVFMVQHGVAREAIEGSLPRLREVLEQSGLQLSSTEVRDQSQSSANRDSSGNTRQGPAQGQFFADDDLAGAVERPVILGRPSALIDYYI